MHKFVKIHGNGEFYDALNQPKVHMNLCCLRTFGGNLMQS